MCDLLNRIDEFSCSFLPSFIQINFILILGFLFISIKPLKNQLSEINGKAWAIVFFIFVIALIIRIFLPSHHPIMFMDEPYYILGAKNIISGSLLSSFELYLKPIAWPFLLSILFRFVHVNAFSATYLSSFLGALTAINIFLIAFTISKNKIIGIIASLFFMLLPSHILWSATVDASVASHYFITLSIVMFLFYREKNDARVFLLFLSILAFAVQFRVENYILLLIYFMAFILFRIKLKTWHLIPVIAMVIITLPNFFRSYSYQLGTNWLARESGGFAGSSISFRNLIYNSLHLREELLDPQTITLTLLSVTGIAYMFKIKQKKELIFLLYFIFLFYIVYFSSWLQTLARPERLFINFLSILVVFAAYGVLYIKKTLIDFKKNINFIGFVFVLTGLSISNMFHYKDIGNIDYPKLLESEALGIIEKDMPPDSIVICPEEVTFGALTNQSFAGIDDFLKYPDFRKQLFIDFKKVLFFNDYFCQYWDSYYSPIMKKKCFDIVNSFNVELYKVYILKNIRYELFVLKDNTGFVSEDAKP